MSELIELLKANKAERALEAHPRIAPLDPGRVEEWLLQRDERGRMTREAAVGLVTLARERCQALLLDETFAEAKCERALEPHARLGLVAVAMLWGMYLHGQMEAVMAWARERHREIELEEKDRYRYGWRGDPAKTRELGGGWQRAEEAIAAVKKANPRWIPKILCMGGNGSSKSEYGGWKVIKTMVEKKGAQVAVLCPSLNQARKVMMSRCYDNLPAEWRPDETGKLKSGITGNISYTRKMGFTENMFILPNGSRCTFYFYLEGDPAGIEGDQLDLVVADEEVPVEWLETVEYRLARTGGTLLALFTPISGYIAAVRWFRGVGKARAILTRVASLIVRVLERSRENDEDVVKGREVPAWEPLPPDAVVEPVEMPLMEYGADATKRVVYFWTEDCCYPMHGYETLRQLLITKRARVAEIKTRAYGFPTAVRDARFPILSEEVHAVPLERARREIPKDVSWFMYLDPAKGRNHIMQWWAKSRNGDEWIVREWPQQDDYIPGVGAPGAWAVENAKGKQLDGSPGPAQQPWGLMTEQYVVEMDRIEMELAAIYEGKTDGEKIHVVWRMMDTRGGKAGIDGKDYFTEFARCKRPFRESSGSELNSRSDNPDAICGVSLITDALGYNTQKPLGPDNRPRLRVVYEPADVDAGMEHPRGCGNTWDSLKNWTGADGLKGARKDWIDLCHYAQRADMRWVNREALAKRKAQTWGGYGS